MSNRSLRLFLVLSGIVLSSIIVLQGYWLYRAWQLSAHNFDRRVAASLRVVNTRINQFYKLDNNTTQPVRRIASNYYVVDIPSTIDAVILGEYIKQEFQRNDIRSDFEFGIYDCATDQLRYGGYVCYADGCNGKTVQYKFPGVNHNSYYFGVYFPSVSLAGSSMNMWLLSSGAILILIAIFCVAIYIALRQKRLSEIQKDFVNNITHEFKTPVATISLSAEALQMPAVLTSPERAAMYAGIIRQESDRLRQHTERILQAELMSDRDQIDIRPIDVNATIHRLVDNITPQLSQRGATVRLDLSDKAPMLMTDEFHFTNIIYNLVDNALKYCDGTPQVVITTVADHRHITVSVRDNGLGISSQEQKNIFKRFYRVPTGNTHNVRGFGLGLYYVKTILKRLRGEIRVVSEYGAGSDFSIIFNA